MKGKGWSYKRTVTRGRFGPSVEYIIYGPKGAAFTLCPFTSEVAQADKHVEMMVCGMNRLSEGKA